MSDEIKAARMPAFEPSHPGAIIRDMLGHERVSATAAAKRIGVAPPTLNNIMRGRASISADMALRLSAFCGNSAEFWLRLQEQFDLWHRSQALAGELVKIERLSIAAPSDRERPSNPREETSTTEAEAYLVEALKHLADAALTAGLPREAPAFQAALDAIDNAERR